MKKILLAIALTITLGLTASAQNDGFFRWNATDEETYRYSEGGDNFNLPTIHGSDIDYDAPLGSGLLVLTALGAGYALKKKRK